ncbi:hypothetical protein NGRA_1365 [Nosema granulosis]|uniref:Uncharacterized protein n=1 Tax=Nosema granulosis TaxID=83296 RepID=A0A9P6GYL7_9MICR|nr:hypothetical protein NGRA_1365 [Nosema granulosis]
MSIFKAEMKRRCQAWFLHGPQEITKYSYRRKSSWKWLLISNSLLAISSQNIIRYFELCGISKLDSEHLNADLLNNKLKTILTVEENELNLVQDVHIENSNENY